MITIKSIAVSWALTNQVVKQNLAAGLPPPSPERLGASNKQELRRHASKRFKDKNGLFFTLFGLSVTQPSLQEPFSAAEVATMRGFFLANINIQGKGNFLLIMFLKQPLWPPI